MNYYDYGPIKDEPKNALLVAAADSAGNILHYYKGFINVNRGEVRLYPYQPIRGKSFTAEKRIIALDMLRSRESLRITQTEQARGALNA